MRNHGCSTTQHAVCVECARATNVCCGLNREYIDTESNLQASAGWVAIVLLRYSSRLASMSGLATGLISGTRVLPQTTSLVQIDQRGELM